MVRKLKTYQTSSGFFDLAVAAPREHETDQRIEKDRAEFDRRLQAENARGQAEEALRRVTGRTSADGL